MKRNKCLASAVSAVLLEKLLSSQDRARTKAMRSSSNACMSEQRVAGVWYVHTERTQFVLSTPTDTDKDNISSDDMGMRAIMHDGHRRCRQRPVFSVFESLYAFAEKKNLGRVGRLETAELTHIRVAIAMLPFTVHRTGLPFSAEVYCSDPSDWGFALHVRSCELFEVDAVASVVER